MVFISDKQRRFVMAKIRMEANLFRTGRVRTQFITDRQKGFTLKKSLSNATKLAIELGRKEREIRAKIITKQLQKSLLAKGFKPKEIKKVFKTFPIKR